MNPIISEFREKFVARDYGNPRTIVMVVPSEEVKEIEDFWLAKIDETEKAFGGCKNCYGKGYATQMLQEEGYEDFGGKGYIKKPEININFCTCERGKQLKQLLVDNNKFSDH